jgi:hypothetical protein
MKCKFLKNCLITSRYAMMLIVGALSMTGTASATLIESIAALDDGDKYRVLFVTSTKRDATSSDITDYNTFVNTAAQAGSVTSGLGLTWKALASTDSVNARTNTGIVDDDPIVWLFNTDGVIVAESGKDLWDRYLMAPINQSEHGELISDMTWTGMDAYGDSMEFLSLGGFGDTATYGHAPRINYPWANGDDGGFLKTNQLALYGASSLAVAGTVQVTSPGTFILLTLGLAGLSFSRYRKQS